jgi:predicted RNA methylase
VNTGGVIPLSNLNLTANNWVFGVQYQAVNPAVDFAEILKGLNIPYKEFIFIDLGSGKGRAVLLASSIPFKKIVGIEFSEKLNHIAEGNVGRWPGEAKRCRQIELICMDAAEYRFPEEPFVLYMYNPFGLPVMERVVENVTEAFRKHPRRIIVVYFTPKHSDLWEGVTFLKRVQVQPGYHVYDTYSGVD